MTKIDFSNTLERLQNEFPQLYNTIKDDWIQFNILQSIESDDSTFVLSLPRAAGKTHYLVGTAEILRNLHPQAHIGYVANLMPNVDIAGRRYGTIWHMSMPIEFRCIKGFVRPEQYDILLFDEYHFAMDQSQIAAQMVALAGLSILSTSKTFFSVPMQKSQGVYDAVFAVDRCNEAMIVDRSAAMKYGVQIVMPHGKS